MTWQRLAKLRPLVRYWGTSDATFVHTLGASEETMWKVIVWTLQGDTNKYELRHLEKTYKKALREARGQI